MSTANSVVRSTIVIRRTLFVEDYSRSRLGRTTQRKDLSRSRRSHLVRTLIKAINAVTSASLSRSYRVCTTLRILTLSRLRSSVTLEETKVRTLVSLLVILLRQSSKIFPRHRVRVVLNAIRARNVNLRTADRLSYQRNVNVRKSGRVNVNAINSVHALVRQSRSVLHTNVSSSCLQRVLLRVLARTRNGNGVSVLFLKCNSRYSNVVAAVAKISSRHRSLVNDWQYRCGRTRRDPCRYCFLARAF